MRANSISIKYILLVSAVTALSTGCTSISRNGEWPQPRPPGVEYKTIGRTPGTVLAAATEVDIVPSDAITLEQALALALIRNPRLESFSHAVLAAQARISQSKLLPNPAVIVGISEFDRDGAGFDSSEIEVVLGQRLELGGKRRWRTRVAKSQGELAGWDYESKRLDVFTETTQRFTAVIAAQWRLELAQAAATLAEQTCGAVTERVKAGKEPPVQATKALAELEMVHLDTLKTETALMVSQKTLVAMWGAEQPHFLKVAGNFDSVIDALPPLERLRIRLSSNPDLARGDAELKLRQAVLASEKAARVPDLKASIGLKRFEEDGTDSLAFGIGFPLPLFNQNQGNIAAAKYELARAEAARRATEITLTTELVQAYGTLRLDRERALTLQSKVIPAMEDAFAAASEGYRQGKFGFLDMLDAQRSLFKTRRALVDALSDYHNAVAKIQRITGIGIEELLKDKKEEKR